MDRAVLTQMPAVVPPRAAREILRIWGDEIAARAEFWEGLPGQSVAATARALRATLDSLRTSAALLEACERREAAARHRGAASSTSSGGNSGVPPDGDGGLLVVGSPTGSGGLTVSGAAEQLGVSPRQVRNLCRERRLPAVGGGGRGRPYRIRQADLDDYRERRDNG